MKKRMTFFLMIFLLLFIMLPVDVMAEAPSQKQDDNISVSVVNSTDANRNDTDKLGTAYECILTEAGDELEITISFNLKALKNTSNGELFSSLIVLVPRGFEYVAESLQCSRVSNGHEYVIEDFSDLGIRQAILQSEKIYRNSIGEIVFLENDQQGYHLPDGNMFFTGAKPDAIQEYNRRFATDYADGNFSYSLCENVLLFSFLKAFNIDDFLVTFRVNKNYNGSRDGFYEFGTGAIYRVPNGDITNLSVLEANVYIASYGLDFTVCEGDIPDDVIVNNEVLWYRENAKKITGAVLDVYEYICDLSMDDTYDEMLKKKIDEHGIREYCIVPNEAKTVCGLYSMTTDVTSDENGKAIVGGLSGKKRYLIRQSTFTTGYAEAQTYYLIYDSDWTTESVMEGNLAIDTLWLDYAGLYLVSVGSRRTIVYYIVGISLMVLAIVLRTIWGFYRSKKYGVRKRKR